jgi:S-(hydroxymethyl)glutathione dehydrogenase/alcohol dehydrogenase
MAPSRDRDDGTVTALAAAQSRATARRGRHVKIRAAVLREVKKGYSIEELELEPPHAGEALVKYAYTGYCHSDLSNLMGRIEMALPMVAGHECAGIVEAVGPDVTRVKVGDHVVGTWMIPCGHCPQCRRGLGNVCTGNFTHFVSGTMLDGTTRMKDSKGKPVLHGNFVSGFSDRTVVPEGGLVPIRKDMPLDWAALISCCIPTGWGAVTKMANVQPGDKVAVWGLGGVGQNTLRAAKMRQANPLIAVDLEESRREQALELGATHFICNAKDDPVPIIQGLTGGGADIIFEASGDPGAIVQAWWALGMAGRLMVIGIMPQDQVAAMPLTFMALQQKSMIGGLYGSVSVQDDIPKLCDLAMTGEMKLDKIVEGKFKLEDLNDIAEKMEKRQLGGRWVCEWD